MELYDTNDRDYIKYVCAHTIGRKLKVILSKDPPLLNRVLTILRNDKDNYWDKILLGLIE
jgi:hypothetical protein